MIRNLVLVWIKLAFYPTIMILFQDRMFDVDLITYLKEVSMSNIVKHQHTTLKRMGLYIHYQ